MVSFFSIKKTPRIASKMTSITDTTEPAITDVLEVSNRVVFPWTLVDVVMLVLSEDVKLMISSAIGL